MKEGRACFEAWAGDHEWSDWTKPTLFAANFAVPVDPRERSSEDALVANARALLAKGADAHLNARASDGSRNCLVVDCAGPDSVALGVLLAERGFAPVVLFNGVTSAARPLVENGAVVRALADLTPRLGSTASPAPAFLLDSRRTDGVPAPSRYDNRWLTFPQDFPSAGRLQAAGIKRCYLLTDPQRVADDLAHVLRRWQEAGIEIHDATGAFPALLDIKKPLWFKQVFYRSLALAGFRPNAFGGFGAIIPEVRSGGYG